MTHQLRTTDMKFSWFMKIVTVSLCSQCCSPDKCYSEWRQAEDAGGNFTTCNGLFREPTQQVSTDCVFMHKWNRNISCVDKSMYDACALFFLLQYRWARKTENHSAEGSSPGGDSGRSGKRFWNERFGVQQWPAAISEYQQRHAHHSQLRG